MFIREYLNQDQQISYEELIVKSVGNDKIQLSSYPVGDLVSKLSNNGPEKFLSDNAMLLTGGITVLNTTSTQ